MFVFIIFFISLMLVPLIGIEVKGAKRWLTFFGLRFQPIELLKPLFIIFVAKIIVSNEKTEVYKRYLYSFFTLLIIIMILINQPDLGQTFLLTLTWVTMIFISGFNMII